MCKACPDTNCKGSPDTVQHASPLHLVESADGRDPKSLSFYLFPFTRPYLPLLALALVLLTISGALEALIVLLLEPVINLWSGAGTTRISQFDFLRNLLDFLPSLLGLDQGNELVGIALLLVLFSLIKGLSLYLSEYLMVYSGQKVVAQLRKTLFAGLLDHSLSFYTRHSTGHLMARIVSDTERLQEAVSKQLADGFRQLILLVTFLTVVFVIDWKLSLFSLAVLPVVLWLTVKMGKRVHRLTWDGQQRVADLSHSLQEAIAGQRIVKAFGMESYERERFRGLADRLVSINLKNTRVTALSSPLMEFIGYLVFAPFLLYINWQIASGVSLGAFVAFVVALFKLYEPLRKLSRMHLHFQQAFACASRIFELLHLPPEIQDRPGAADLAPFRRELRFQDVNFSFGEDVPVLTSINLTIRRGEIVAVVGKSGAGKSTLASLILRFYDVTEGRVTIDGSDLREVTQASVRRQIALVSQDTFLFNDTVRNNIAYGRKNCRFDRILEASRAANCHDFVEGFPQGYATVIGERGHRLSGGQRQRIAIARAVLKGAPILILDEATSALDGASEKLVQEALNRLMSHCTTLVIAHRLSTVRRADRIIVLDGGRIVEQGVHAKLMARAGIYRQLYQLQDLRPTEVGGGQDS